MSAETAWVGGLGRLGPKEEEVLDRGDSSLLSHRDTSTATLISFSSWIVSVHSLELSSSPDNERDDAERSKK
jgi:hypothetical protein